MSAGALALFPAFPGSRDFDQLYSLYLMPSVPRFSSCDERLFCPLSSRAKLSSSCLNCGEIVQAAANSERRGLAECWQLRAAIEDAALCALCVHSAERIGVGRATSSAR